MRIGAYEVTRTIGQGGMGVVHAARGPSGEVAIKVLRATSAEALARFERESRLHARLGEVAGFVPVIEVGRSPQGPYIVMPLLPGGTLRDRLRTGPLGVEASIDLATQLGLALGRAHAQGIVHRDMKPENVLFDGRGRPFVADLGLAKHFTDETPGASRSLSLSHAGSFRGTAGYMAPEQAADAKSVGPAADVFALGAILHECLGGVPVFRGETPLEVLAQVDKGEIPELDAPGWLVAIVHRALAHDPAERFEDGAAFAAALRRGPVAAKPPSFGVAWVLLAAFVVALVAAVAVAATSRRPPPRVSPPPAPPPPRPADVAPTTSRATNPLPRGDLVEEGIRLLAGKEVPRDPVEAFRVFREAASAGNRRAMVYLAAALTKGIGVEKDVLEAFRWEEKAAKLGDTDAMLNLGARLQDGIGTTRDEAAGAAWFEKSARAGNVKGMYALALALYNGRGIAKDGDAALRWLREAVAHGNLDATDTLGILYRDGTLVARDDEESVRLFREAADAGHPPAMTNLGNMYAIGHGVPQDDALAARWYREAANHGDVAGGHNYGVALLTGRGAAKDEPQGLQWIRLAADADYPEAYFSLGTVYAEGRGVAKDEAEAVRWYRKAAERGLPKAHDALRRLGAE